MIETPGLALLSASVRKCPRPPAPLRCRLLEQLADGRPRTATACAGHLAKRLQATIKHLLVQLLDAALAEMSPDPADSRSQLYTLSPKSKSAEVNPEPSRWILAAAFCGWRGRW